MDYSSRSGGGLRNSALAPALGKRQVARAWALLLAGFILFLTLTGLAGSSVYSYVRDGTQSRTASLEPVSGQSLLVRSSNQQDWRLVTDRTEVNEGDQITTGSATVGWITLFDQGTIEISENSLVQINRMRTSRLFRDQKEIEVEPIRGSIYVGMAPRGEFGSSIVRVRSGPATVLMRDEIRTSQTGSFLVETQRLSPGGDEDEPILSVRVAVLRGEASVSTDVNTRTLSPDEQIVVQPSGEHGQVTTAMRELIRNGDFSRDLADWVEYHDLSGEPAGESGSVERVPVDQWDGAAVALQVSRSSHRGDNWETGLQQTIGQSLRVHSSLNLSLDLRIDEQHPPGGGDALTEYPLIVKILYVDVHDHNREWWHGFYILDDSRTPVPSDLGTRIERAEWTSVSLDLRNLEPLPKQISSVIVYSSGHSYRTNVTNISLTSSETGDRGYD